MTNWFKKTFGKKFGIIDIFLVALIIGYPIYKVKTEGWQVLAEDFVYYFWITIVIGYIVNLFIKYAKK